MNMRGAPFGDSENSSGQSGLFAILGDDKRKEQRAPLWMAAERGGAVIAGFHRGVNLISAS
jgi:hypothetical protein